MHVESLVPESEECTERERERVFNQLSTSCCFSPFHAFLCISCQSVLTASKSLLALDALDTKQ